MRAQILSRAETKTEEIFVVAVRGSVGHEPLQLGQGFLDLWHRPRAIDQLSPFRIELPKDMIMSDDEKRGIVVTVQCMASAPADRK